MEPIRAEYSLSAHETVQALMSRGLSYEEAKSMVVLASRFEEVRIPFNGEVLAVDYHQGYYNMQINEVKTNAGT